MGLFRVQVRIASPGDPSLERGEDMELLVDTGATYTVLPSDLLRRIGVGTLGKISVAVADGRTAERDYGVALLRIDGRTIGATVLSGAGSDLPLLGATALEQASLGVDPVRKRLVAFQAVQA